MQNASDLTIVRLLGQVRIDCSGVRLDTRLSVPESLLLAALLCSNGMTVRRDEVASRLWPELAEDSARDLLRRCLYSLQESLPAAGEPWIESDDRTIVWRPVEQTLVDAVEFTKLAADPLTFDLAAHLYAGEFAPRLEHPWVVKMRASLAQRMRAVLSELILRHADLRDPRGELSYCEQLLQLDPWREDLIRRSIVLRCKLGDRTGAAAIFETFRTKLKTEVGVDPMPETQHCADEVSRGRSPVITTAFVGAAAFLI